MKKTVMRMPETGSSDAAGIVLESAEPANKNATKKLSTMFAAEDRPRPQTNNRPRMVGDRKHVPSQSNKGKISIVHDAGPTEKRISMMEELAIAKGKPIDTDKRRAENGGSTPKRGASGSKMPERVSRPDPVMESPTDLDLGPARSSTVFKQTLSSVRPHGPTTPVVIDAVGSASKPLAPGQRVTFEE